MVRSWQWPLQKLHAVQKDVSQENVILMRDFETQGSTTDTINQPTHRRWRLLFPQKLYDFRWPQGCRGGVAFALVYGILILILNLILACWLIPRTDSIGDLVVISSPSCQSMKNLVLALHLLINLLATLTLAASNYCMQILISPNREDLDRAHKGQRWMCIGIPNIRNLAHIPWKRRIPWLILALSSLPIHLLWNSVIVGELAANDYYVGLVSLDFTTGGPVDCSAVSGESSDSYTLDFSFACEQGWLAAMRADPTNLTVGECIKSYSKTFVSDYSNIALVMNYRNSTNSLLALEGVISFTDSLQNSLQDWATREPENPAEWIPSPGSPALADTTVKYCLAQRTPHTCDVGIVPIVAWIALVPNALKVISFFSTLVYTFKASTPLVTIGDMIESLILKPDSSNSLKSTTPLKNDPDFWYVQRRRLPWLPERRRWICGASCGAWLSIFVPALLCIAGVIIIFFQDELNYTISYGFGSADLVQNI